MHMAYIMMHGGSSLIKVVTHWLHGEMAALREGRMGSLGLGLDSLG